MTLKSILGLILRTTKTDPGGHVQTYHEKRIEAKPWVADFLTALSAEEATGVLSEDPNGFLKKSGGTMNGNAEISFNNGAKARGGVVTALNPGGLGYEIVCSAGFVDLFMLGEHYALQDDGVTVRGVHHCRSEPDQNMDADHGYVVGSRRYHDDGRIWECVVSTPENAVWTLIGQGVIEAFDEYTISDTDNGKVIQIGTDNNPTAYVYLDEAHPPKDGFSCSIVARTTNCKVAWNGGSSTLVGPGNATGVWAINDAVNNGVGMGATLYITDSGTLIARIVGAVEISV